MYIVPETKTAQSVIKTDLQIKKQMPKNLEYYCPLMSQDNPNNFFFGWKKIKSSSYLGNNLLISKNINKTN